MAIPEHLRWIPTGKTLGAGGQGTIHIVFSKDKLCEKKFALKELHNHGDEKARRRFQKKSKPLKKLITHQSSKCSIIQKARMISSST